MQPSLSRMFSYARFPRLILGCLTCLFIFLYLISTLVQPQNSNEVDDVVYTYPREILNRVLRLEVKVDNITNFFTRLTDNQAGKSIMKHFITSNVDSFWNSYDESNITASYEQVYHANNTNHSTKLVTTSHCGRHLKLLILITTHATHVRQREFIRSTWGTDPKSKEKRWKTYFLVGRTKRIEDLKKIKLERDTFNDLVIGDVIEDFYNLTYKVQMGFEWAVQYCSFDFMLKGDDDVFVNMPNLFNFLDNKDTVQTELYAGNVQYEAIVLRTGKYGIDKHEFRKRIYPRYCSGGGFILSRDVVVLMNRLFRKVPAIKIDDAYIGEVALKGGIDVVHNEHFRMFEDEKCTYNPNSIVHHPVKTENCMDALYKESLKVR